MKVILEQDVKGLGQKGDVVTVKDGFARNFLFPRGYALRATAKNLEAIEKKLRRQKEHLEEEKKEAEEFAKKLSAVSCTVAVDVHEGDRLYGSLSPSQIASALQNEGISLDKKKII
jgi:large subunit ribosomal protein L9